MSQELLLHLCVCECVWSHQPLRCGGELALDAMWSRPRPGIVTYLTHCIRKVLSWGFFMAQSPGRLKCNHKHVLGFLAVTQAGILPQKCVCFFVGLCVFYSLPPVMFHQHKPRELLPRITLCFGTCWEIGAWFWSAKPTFTLVKFSGAMAVPPLASMFSSNRPNHRSISSWLEQ